MARDRQRAKQRRAKRQAGGSGRSAGPRTTARDAQARDAKAREIGLGDERADEAGLGTPTPTPTPTPVPDALAGATPYADEAKLAEAGARIPDEDGELFDEEDFERAPDEVEGDLVPASSGAVDPAVAEEHAEAARPERRRRGRILTFLGHCVDELRRVQWPNRRQVGQATAVVLGFVVLAGGYLGLMDAIWKPIVEAII